jgi:thioredoxin 1
MVRTFDTPINTGDQSIDRVLGTGLPVALVFVDGAPEAALADTLNRLAREHAGKLLVALVQAKDNPASLRRFGISRAPAVVAVRDSQPISQAEGIRAADVQQHIAYLLGQGPKPQPQPQPHTHASTGSAPRQSQQNARTGARPATHATGPQAVTDATFEQAVLRSPQPVLVDFWAPWCGPCHSMEPAVERLARDAAGHMRVVKINVDENPMVAQRYDVQSIPTMLVFQNGQVADRWVGAQPEGAIRQRISRWLAA